ncbi:MAG: LysR family transcriptional regulator [Myxococcales bacterium]|nr:LysR family transcriptional regulator [Myxococcales bacterium]
MQDNLSVASVSAMLVFARVVEFGSFTEAARRLGVSKASVSREIAALETRLGAQLLRRTTRRMSLTEIGEVFYERCLRVVEEAEAAELSVSRLRAAPHGVVRIAAPMSFGHLQLAPRIARFVDRYPDVRVELELTDRTVDLVHERIDLSLRIGRPRSQSYVMRRLCPIRALVVATRDYLDHAGVPEEPTDLLRHDCLLYRGPTHTWHFDGGQRLEAEGRVCIDNGDALRRAVLTGHGIAYLPTFLVGDDVRAGLLETPLSDRVHPGSGLYTVYPASRHLSPKVRALIDWLVEEFAPEPEWDRGLPVEGRPPGRTYRESA